MTGHPLMSKENRSYFYPSVSLSAVISDMVQKNGGSMPDWFSFAKVRASFAEVGNDLDPYQLYNVYTISKDANGNSNGFLPEVTLFDSSVKSELIKSWEVGATYVSSITVLVLMPLGIRQMRPISC